MDILADPDRVITTVEHAQAAMHKVLDDFPNNFDRDHFIVSVRVLEFLFNRLQRIGAI